MEVFEMKFHGRYRKFSTRSREGLPRGTSYEMIAAFLPATVLGILSDSFSL